MAYQIGVVESAITISGDSFNRVPNSTIVNLGFSTSSVKTGVKGGGSIEMVTFTNLEDMKGKVEFDVWNSKENQALYRRKRLFQVHDVQVSQLYEDGTRTSYSFPVMVFTSSPDLENSYEGKFKVTMEGGPAK